MNGTDNIQIEVLEDGRIRVVTDPISGINHVNAEGFLKLIAQLGGGETSRTRRTDAHHHTHGHSHDHAHEGHSH